MRRGRRKARLEDHSREVVAMPASLMWHFRLAGQVLEWGFACFDDRSGSEKLSK